MKESEPIVCGRCHRGYQSSYCQNCIGLPSNYSAGGSLPIQAGVMAISPITPRILPRVSLPVRRSVPKPKAETIETVESKKEHQKVVEQFDQVAKEVLATPDLLIPPYIPDIAPASVIQNIKQKVKAQPVVAALAGVLLLAATTFGVLAPRNMVPYVSTTQQIPVTHEYNTYQFQGADSYVKELTGHNDRSSVYGRCAGLWAEYKGIKKFDPKDQADIKAYQVLRAEDVGHHDRQVQSCVDFYHQNNSPTMFDSTNQDLALHFENGRGSHVLGNTNIGSLNTFKEAKNWDQVFAAVR